VKTLLHTTVIDESLTDPNGYDLTGWTYASDTLTTRAFKGDTVTLAPRADNFQDLGDCIVGRTDLKSVAFSARGLSILTIAP
jgi:hypothetical protein